MGPGPHATAVLSNKRRDARNLWCGGEQEGTREQLRLPTRQGERPQGERNSSQHLALRFASSRPREVTPRV